MVEGLMAELEPVVAAAGLELFDVEIRSGILLVTVDRAGGVDLEALTDANRAVSAALDRLDPIPGRYTLEVSSPGVERRLRTPAHFAKAVGETVSVKTRPQVPGDRRLRGRLVAADQVGLDLVVEGGDDTPVRLAFSDIDKARTVFIWGPEPLPNAPKAKAHTADGPTPPKAGRTPQSKRKQVATP